MTIKHLSVYKCLTVLILLFVGHYVIIFNGSFNCSNSFLVELGKFDTSFSNNFHTLKCFLKILMIKNGKIFLQKKS